MKYIFLILLFLLSGRIFCQVEESTLVRFIIHPPAESLMIGDSLLKKGNKIALSPGRHPVKIWSPTYTLTDTSVTVNEGDKMINFVLVQKDHSETYTEYLQKVNSYENKRKVHFTLPLATTALLVGSTTITYFYTQARYDEAKAAFMEYKFDNQPTRVNSFEEFERARDKYRNGITSFYIQAGALAISSYFLYKGVKWARAKRIPKYGKEKNPLALENVSVLPANGFQTSGFSMGLTFSLN